ncbi:MAG: hypothetical protein ACRC5R_06335 [Mycoplasmatales bacterium]
MLQAKRKVDLLFLCSCVIIGLIGFVYPNAFYIALGVLIGFLSTSISMGKDIRKVLKEAKGIWLNLGINMIIYAIALVISILINETTFIFAAIGLMAYRYSLLYLIRK